MGNIKIAILIIILFFVSCKKGKTEVFDLKLEQKGFPWSYCDYFTVNNPPEETDSIISFFDREIKRTHKEREIKIDYLIKNRNIAINISKKQSPELFKDVDEINKKDVKYIASFYYRENFFFDRTYKVPIRQPFFSWERWLYIGYDIRYRGHEDDRFIIIYYKMDEFEYDDPVLPYMYIKKIDSFYFPNGLRTNPNIHWAKGDWIPR